MDTRWIKLCFLLILCTEYIGLADSATLQGYVSPTTPIKNQQHSIRCEFQLLTGESFEGLRLYMGTSPTPEKIVALLRASGSSAWSASVPDNLKQRGYLQGSKDEGRLQMVINNTECSDKDRVYLCQLDYVGNSGLVQPTSNPVTALSQLQAAPVAPIQMTMTPPSDIVMEKSNVTFECKGNVGRPAGNFSWYRTIVNVGDPSTDLGQDVTNQAVTDTEALTADGCTYSRSSRLTLTLTRTEVDQRLVVRCRVNQAQVDGSVTGCSDSNFCNSSPQINVQYPVKVSVSSDTVSTQEGKALSLMCITMGNPVPTGVQWQKQGENATSGNTLTLPRVTMENTGYYVCTAFNNISGVLFNDSVTVSVTIVKTTTPPPTTTTSSTTSTTTSINSGSTQAEKAGSDDTTTIIIIVVVVGGVLLIIAIIAIIVCIKRRKGREVEEPPEKPFNNNAGINTVAARPDLVRSSYDKGPQHNKHEDGLTYAELQLDNKPRSRRPLAIDDSLTDYSDVSMPHV